MILESTLATKEQLFVLNFIIKSNQSEFWNEKVSSIYPNYTLLQFFVSLFNGCVPLGGGNSSRPDYEGTWVAKCKESEDISGLYTKNIFSLSGKKYNDETLTYSNADCIKRPSGLDFQAKGTLTTETGCVVDGKQLIKINYVAAIN